MSDPRKAEYPDRFEAAKAASARARGELAEAAFAIDVVLTAITAAAIEGFSFVAIEPPKPIDLRGTDTWKGTAAKLAAMGFTVEARERPGPRDTLGMSWAMVVTWLT